MEINTISSAEAIQKQVDIYLSQGYELKSMTNTSAELICYYKWTWRDTLILFCCPVGGFVLPIFNANIQSCYLNVYDGKVIASGCTINRREEGNPNKKPFLIFSTIVFIIFLIWFIAAVLSILSVL